MPLKTEDKLEGTDIVVRVVSPSKSEYTVVRWAATQAWSCNCIGWVLHMSKRVGHLARDTENHCTHVKMVLDALRDLLARGSFVTRPKGKRGSYQLLLIYPDAGATRRPGAMPQVVALPLPLQATGRAIARDGEEI